MPDNSAAMRVGWIGAGAIGLPMLRRMVQAGHAVVAFDKAPARISMIRQSGIPAAASPAAVGLACDVVFLSLPDGEAVTDAVFGPEGLTAAGVTGKLVVDTSSIDPVLTRDLAARFAHNARGHWVDAPVSGGVDAASQGTLVAFLGGTGDDVARARPAIACFAAHQTHLGPTGSGQWAELCNQAVVCAAIALWADVFALARAGNLDPQILVNALDGAGGDSHVRAAFGERLAAGAFVPSPNLEKDFAAVLARGRDAGIELTIFAAAARVFGSRARHS